MYFWTNRHLTVCGLVIGFLGCAGEEPSAYGVTLGAHDTPVVTVAFSTSGKTAYSADGESFILAWDVDSAKPLLGGSMFRRARTVALSPDGKVGVVAVRNVVRTLDLENVREVNTFESGIDSATSFPTYVHLSSDGSRGLFVAYGGHASLWNLLDGRALHPNLGITGGYYDRDASSFSPDDSLVSIASSARSNVQIRDAETGKLVRTILADKRGTRSTGFSLNGAEIAIVGIDNNFRLWSVQSGALLTSFDASKFSSINRIAFSSYGNSMITAHNDGWITIWDIQTGSSLKHFYAHDGWVETIAVSLDGRGLVSGGLDGSVRYWNLVEILAD